MHIYGDMEHFTTEIHSWLKWHNNCILWLDSVQLSTEVNGHLSNCCCYTGCDVMTVVWLVG